MTNDRLEEIKQIVINIYKVLKIKEFPIDLNYILDSYGIQIYTYEECDHDLCKKYSEDSFSFGSKIFYDETMYPKRIRFSIAHEIGHIMLKHTKNPQNKRIEEEEADRFAASLLVPLAAVARIDYLTLDVIMECFDISKHAASIALYEYKHNYHGYNFMSDCDKKLHEYLFDDLYTQSREYTYYNNPHSFEQTVFFTDKNWLFD